MLGLGFRLRPATPGWGDGVCVFACALLLYPAIPGWGVQCGCVCLYSGFGCAPPILAGVFGCVCVRVRAPLVPRHSCLGCAAWVCVLGFRFRLRPATPGWGVGVCVFVCLLPLFPATPGWGVRREFVCLGSGFGCAPPLLAGVLGCVCAGVRAPPVPRHSWLGFVWVCVFGLGIRCAPPLLAGVLGCLCPFVCVLPLYPATPGWGVRRGCVCLGSGLGCAPPLLTGLLGCVCARVRAQLVPRYSWLGCAVWVCLFGLGFRLRPANPGWGVWVCSLLCVLPLFHATPGWGVRRGCVCLGSGFGCAPPLLAGVLGCVCAGVRAPYVPRHSWLGCALWMCVFGPGFWLRPATPYWGVMVCVFVCVPPSYPASPGWGVRCGCGCLGSGFGCAPPLLAGVLGCACLCACSPCTPPLLAGVCGVGVCVWVRVSAAPCHSWLGCSGVCVLVWALPLYPASPGWGVQCGCVCLVWGFGCAPPPLAGVLGCACLCACSPGTPPLLAGVCGVGVCAWARVSVTPRQSWLGCWVCVCAGVRAPHVPRHSWLGCAVWVWVFGLGFRLRPATPGLGVWLCLFVCVLPPYPATLGWGVRRGCACLGSGFGWAPSLLAGVFGCVCAGLGAPFLPRHSWPGCAVWVCVFGLLIWLRPATPGCGVGVCAFVCVLPLYPATPGWGVRRGCVCLGSGVEVCVCCCAHSACTLPLLVGVCGVGVGVWARVSAAPRHSWLGCLGVRVGVCASLVPRHSWLACAAWVCVLRLGFRLRLATPGWGVGVCVCSCARSARTPPLLAGVCGVGVCLWAQVWAAPRHPWLGCWGACVLVCLLLLYPATPGWGVRCGCVCSGSCFGCAPLLLAGVCRVWVGCCLAPVPVPWFVACCARCPGSRHPVAVVAWHLPLYLGCGLRRAPLACLVTPRWCAAPRPVRSLSVLRSAFQTPWCLPRARVLAFPALLGCCAGHAEAGREPGSLCLPLAPAEAGAPGSLRVVPVRGPAMGLSLAGPSGVGLGLRALRCFACVDPVTDPSGFQYRPSFDGGLSRCTGAVSCGRRHRPLRVGGRHAWVPCVCACACFLGRVGWAGLPGAFWCASPFPVAVLVALFVCSAPTGLGLPCLCCFWVFSFFLLLCAPLVFGIPCFPALGALGLGDLWSFPPPSFVCFSFFFPLSPLHVFFCGFFVLCSLCGAVQVCRGLLGVLVCVVVGLVLRRGPVSAFALLFGAPCLCRPLLCCSLLCCVCQVAPCWRRCSSPGCAPPPPSAAGCGVLCCGLSCVVCRRRCYQKAKGRDVYPRVQVNGLGCVCCVRAVCKCVVA